MSFRLNPKILLSDKASPALPAGNVGCIGGTVSEGVHCGGLLALLTNLLMLYPRAVNVRGAPVNIRVYSA